MKRIVSLLAAAAVAAATLFVVAPLASARTAATTIEGHRQGLQVHALENERAARQGHLHGHQQGPPQHDFTIAGKKTKLLKPNKSATLTVTL